MCSGSVCWRYEGRHLTNERVSLLRKVWLDVAEHSSCWGGKAHTLLKRERERLRLSVCVCRSELRVDDPSSFDSAKGAVDARECM